MKFSFVLGLMFSITAYGNTTVKSVPSSATQFIFETLVQSKGDGATPKAPKAVEVKNIECKRGSTKQSQFQCKGTFLIENREVEKSIVGDNNKFFEYLNAKSAISLEEARIGGTYYKASRISCRYSLEGGVYYKCSSDVSVQF